MAQAPGSAEVGQEPLLRTVDLTRHFRLGGMFSKHVLHAVDDFNLNIHEHEIVGRGGFRGGLVRVSDSNQISHSFPFLVSCLTPRHQPGRLSAPPTEG